MKPIVRICQLEGIDNGSALPLAAGMLVASARLNPRIQDAFTFRISIERRAVQPLVKDFGHCEVIGFSLYPWNTAYSLAVIEETRRRWPEARIVVGGPSLPKRPEQIRPFLDAHPEIDVLVSGEGELTFREYLLAVLDDAPLSTVKSLVYRDEEGLHFTTPASRVLDFSQTASPYLDGTFQALLEAHPGHFTMGMLETNRGCPFSCSFCDWSLTRQVIELPLQRVTDEIDWLVSRGIANFCIVDANFGIRPRDHTIARYLATVKEQTQLPGFCYFYLTKNNYRKNLKNIEIFRDAGIACTVGLAVQDFDDEVLSTVSRDNIQTAETYTLRRICAERGIPSRNEIIFGLPGQTYASFTKTILAAMPPFPEHEALIFICRLLDNTEMGTPEQKALHQIESRNCVWASRYGASGGDIDERQELVVSTRDLPLEDWKRAYRFTYLASAGYNLYLMRILYRALPLLFGISIQAFLENLLDAMARAKSGTVLANMGTTLERFIDSILSEGPYMLSMEDAGEIHWDVDEAVVLCAFRDLEGFYGEIKKVTRPLLKQDANEVAWEEMFRVQQAWVPGPGQAQEIEHVFQYDWLALWESTEDEVSLEKHANRLHFSPPPITSIPTFEGFASSYCSLMKARAATTNPMTDFRVDVKRVPIIPSLSEPALATAGQRQ